MPISKAVPAKATPAPKPYDIFVHEIALYPGTSESAIYGCTCSPDENIGRDGTTEKPFIVEETCKLHDYVVKKHNET